MRTADRNRATAYLMRSNGMISGDVESILALYLRQCSVWVTCTDLAVMAATLANGGVNPLTGERASPPSRQRSVERAARLRHVRRGRSVGLRRKRPAKRGVSGGILAPTRCEVYEGTETKKHRPLRNGSNDVVVP